MKKAPNQTPRKEYTGIASVNESVPPSAPAVLMFVNSKDCLPNGSVTSVSQCFELFGNIRDGKFTLIEEWERNWNAQPKRGTRHFAGHSRTERGQDRKSTPVVGYNFVWKQRGRQLTLWAVDNPKDTLKVTLGPRTARALTALIGKHLTGAQG